MHQRHGPIGALDFARGEGIWFDSDHVYFTTKGDNRVWQVNLTTNTYELAYDDNLVTPLDAALKGVRPVMWFDTAEPLRKAG